MGISKSKTKTTTTASPYAAAQPAIDAGIRATQDVFNAQQPILAQNAALAQQAYQGLAPQLFQTSPYVAAAQNDAQAIAGGAWLGRNPGAATYAELQQSGARDPSLATLARLAAGSASPGSYGGIGQDNLALAALQAMTVAGSNPADGHAAAIAGGRYLGAQPSAGFYADTLAGKYLDANPYLDAIVRQSDDAATRAVNQRFAAAGMGAGLSTPYTDQLGRALADSETRLRYGAYKDELNRMGAIGAQSDGAWSGERNRMEEANALTAADYNAGQDRALAAANSLGSHYDTRAQLQLAAQQAGDQAYAGDRSAQLAAAQALGSQHAADDAARLGAAQADDAQHGQQLAQMLQAIGLTGDLSNAQYAGIAPALNLLTTASQIPYYGLNAYAGSLDGLAGKYGTTTGTTTQSQSLGAFLGGLANTGFSAWAQNGFKGLKFK